MAVLTPAWWPRRRVEPAEPMGYESALVPGTFEPIETLGDTGPAPLDAEQAFRDECEHAERQAVRWIVAIALTALGLWRFGWLG
jgi:hypothetical protein